MATKKEDVRSSAAAKSAVEEAELPLGGMVTVVVDDKAYSFPRKRMYAVKFRLLMQKGNDAAAIEYLLGDTEFAKWLDAAADEDGDTTVEAYERLMAEVGRVFGVKN